MPADDGWHKTFLYLGVAKLGDRQVSLNWPVQNFITFLFSWAGCEVENMNVSIRVLTRSNLPRWVLKQAQSSLYKKPPRVSAAAAAIAPVTAAVTTAIDDGGDGGQGECARLPAVANGGGEGGSSPLVGDRSMMVDQGPECSVPESTRGGGGGAGTPSMGGTKRQASVLEGGDDDMDVVGGGGHQSDADEVMTSPPAPVTRNAVNNAAGVPSVGKGDGKNNDNKGKAKRQRGGRQSKSTNDKNGNSPTPPAGGGEDAGGGPTNSSGHPVSSTLTADMQEVCVD